MIPLYLNFGRLDVDFARIRLHGRPIASHNDRHQLPISSLEIACWCVQIFGVDVQNAMRILS